jgi:Rrf2 family protein
VSSEELSRKLRLPYPYLRGILQKLNAKGILRSFKGKGGGFALARPPEKIHLTELIKILQGPITLADCIFRSKVCPGIRTCRLRKVTLKLQETLLEELKPVTLASMLGPAASRRKRGGTPESKRSGASPLRQR